MRDMRAHERPCAVGDPRHAWNLHVREPGAPLIARWWHSGPQREGRRPYSDDGRSEEVVQYRSDAERFQEELRERLRKFSLELHPDKTRLIQFGRFAAERREARGEGKPETFNFLGFTHISGKSRRGKFILRRRMMRERMTAKLHEVKAEMQRRRHQPIPEQGAYIAGVVRGYFAYHAVPTNMDTLNSFTTEVRKLWRKTLRRRGQRDRTTWARMHALTQRWVPQPRILHPWPDERFDVRTQGKSRVR
jgi:RNA-directed DNA polymerase